MLLAFFDAEEQGLQGAHAFVEKPTVPRERLAVNVNFDMVSRSDAREIFVAGPGRWPRLAPLLTPERIAAIVALIPDAWLDAPRDAYRAYFDARLQAPRAFAEEARHAHARL